MITESELLTFDIKTIVELFFYYMISKNFMRTKSSKQNQPNEILLLSNKQLKEVPNNLSSNSVVYLDLSSNRISNLNFSQNLNSLISLHVNDNPLKRLDSINFENLRSLSLDFCNLKSLKKIPMLPNVISLSLVGNSLKNFKYFHIFPNLTKIDLRGNPVSFSAVHTIAAVSSLRLATFNNRAITEQEFSSAFNLSPIVGHALRLGRDPNPVDDEKTASLRFLSSELPLEVKNIGGCLVIRCPKDVTSNVKWYQSSSDESEWELLDCTARTLPVTPMMFLHLIKCQYGNQSFYTDDVIQKNENKAILSFSSHPAIIGSGNVGAILTLSSKPNFPTRFKWLIEGSEEILGDCHVLVVPPEARGRKIIAEIIPYSPVFDKVLFDSLTTEIQISSVHETELIYLSIPDNIVEDEPFEIKYETFPANVKLNFTIEAANTFESSYVPIAKLQNSTSFVPTSKEVGKFLRVTTFVGDRQYCAYSSNSVAKVKATLIKALICGENKTNHPRVFLFDFGDTKITKCTQKWFVDDGANREYISEERIVVPGDDCSDLTLGVEFTVYFDDKAQTFVITADETIEKSKELLDVIDYSGIKHPVEDNKIVMVHTGGWFISDIHSKDGFKLIGESDMYIPKSSDIGKFIRFCSDMTDVIIGPVLPSQSPIKSISLNFLASNGELSVGNIIRADLDFYQNRKCDASIKWIRCSRATPEKLIQDGGNEYVLTYDDYGSKIKARIESTDWQKDSDLTPIIKKGDYNGPLIHGNPIVGETLSVQLNEQDKIRWYYFDEPEILVSEGPIFSVRFIDINHRIRAEINGTYNELTEPVLSISVKEGQVIDFDEVFHRDLTEKTGVLWFRYVFSEQEWREISDNHSYTVSHADIDSVIRVVSYRINSDGAKTSEIFADIGSIIPNPELENQQLSSEHSSNDEQFFSYDNEEDHQKADINNYDGFQEEEEEEEYLEAKLEISKHGQLKIVGNFDPNDDTLKFFWRRWKNGKFDEIKGSSDRKIAPHPSMVGCEIDAGYQNDDTSDVIWTNRILIEHALPPPDVEITEKGNLIPGCKLEINASPIEGLDIRYLWKRWDGSEFENITTNGSSFYTVLDDDIDCYVCCDVFFVDKNGNYGPKTSVETTGPISSDAIVIEGNPIVGCLLRVEGFDDFLKSCKFKWQKKNSNDWTDIGKKRTYRCSCDDLYSYIRVICNSENEERISNEIGPIEVNEDIASKVKDIIKNGSFKFKGKEQNGQRWTIDAMQNVLSIKSRTTTKSANWKNVEIRGASSSERKIEILIGTSFRVSFIPILHFNENEQNSGFDRELCILALRAFKEKAPTPTSPRKK